MSAARDSEAAPESVGVAVAAVANPQPEVPKKSFWSKLSGSVLSAIGMHDHDYTQEDEENRFRSDAWKAPDGTERSVHSVANCQYQIRSLTLDHVKHADHAVNQPGLTKSEHAQDWVNSDGVVRGVIDIVAWQLLAGQKTLAAAMLQPGNYEHCEVQFSDGGVSCLHLYCPPESTQADPTSQRTAPVMLLCPALTSNHADYLVFIEHVVMKLGWSVAVANRRGLCMPLRTPVFHIMGSDDDLHTMVMHLQSQPRFQNRPIVAVGFSIGGNWLMRYLGKFNSPENKIVAAATISSPLNLTDVLVRHEFMADYMLTRLKQKYLEHSKALFSQSPTTQAIYDTMSKASTLHTLAYAHAHMFLVSAAAASRIETSSAATGDVHANNGGAVSRQASVDDVQVLLASPDLAATLTVEVDVHKLDESVNATIDVFDTALWIQRVQVPLLVVMARDDPIVTTTPANIETMMHNPNVVRLFTEAGSHCMFRDNVHRAHLEISRAEGITLNYFRSVFNFSASAGH